MSSSVLVSANTTKFERYDCNKTYPSKMALYPDQHPKVSPNIVSLYNQCRK